MRSQVLRTVSCNISGEVAGEIWTWSLGSGRVNPVHCRVWSVSYAWAISAGISVEPSSNILCFPLPLVQAQVYYPIVLTWPLLHEPRTPIGPTHIDTALSATTRERITCLNIMTDIPQQSDWTPYVNNVVMIISDLEWVVFSVLCGRLCFYLSRSFFGAAGYDDPASHPRYGLAGLITNTRVAASHHESPALW